MMNSSTTARFGFMDGMVRENNVISFLEHHAAAAPQKTALMWVDGNARRTWDGKTPFTHHSVTYLELNNRIKAVAGGLKSLGIGRGDRVIIFVPLSVELYVTMFAVQRIGAIAVFLDSWARRDQLGASAEAVAPKAMISFEQAFALCAAVPGLAAIPLKVVVGPHKENYQATLDQLLTGAAAADIEPVRGSDTALITFTTGSSGTPKGADRTHRFLAAQHRALDKELPYRREDIDMPVFPIFSLNNLAGGVTTLLPAIDLAAPSADDAAAIVNQFFAAAVTCCTVSPSIFVNIAAYCRDQGITLESLRRVVTGGAPVSKDNVTAFKAIAPNADILILYGSTEVEPIAHIEAREMLASDDTRQGVNVGTISEDLDYKFIRITAKGIELDAAGWAEWEVAAGTPGELVVSGDHVCENYYNNEAAFKAAKIRGLDGRIWHRTGDVGLLDGKNHLWLVGRVHNTITRGGAYFFPVHAEILLKRLEFVRQAAFLGLADAKLGEKTCAVFSLKDGFTADGLESYTAAVREVLAAAEIPVDVIRMVDNIPMDPRHHSKVEYSRLREMIDHE